MSAFVDTSGFYALLVATEFRHSLVRRSFRDLLETGEVLWTTSYVLIETVALLQNHLGLAPVRDLQEHVLPLCSITWVDETLHSQGVERLLKTNRRNLSLVDCVSFELMHDKRVPRALALDPHFVEAGFEIIPHGTKSQPS